MIEVEQKHTERGRFGQQKNQTDGLHEAVDPGHRHPDGRAPGGGPSDHLLLHRGAAGAFEGRQRGPDIPARHVPAQGVHGPGQVQGHALPPDKVQAVQDVQAGRQRGLPWTRIARGRS